jgi:hypothetical protein
MSTDGDTKTTPREAPDSAAANLLYQLHIKAKEKMQRAAACKMQPCTMKLLKIRLQGGTPERAVMHT